MEDSRLVLIVDDDPETARMLGQALSPQWRIETVTSPEEAASILRARAPCAALVNLDLPGGGGMREPVGATAGAGGALCHALSYFFLRSASPRLSIGLSLSSRGE
jgi:CheY-like chemotaxis protein